MAHCNNSPLEYRKSKNVDKNNYSSLFLISFNLIINKQKIYSFCQTQAGPSPELTCETTIIRRAAVQIIVGWQQPDESRQVSVSEVD